MFIFKYTALLMHQYLAHQSCLYKTFTVAGVLKGADFFSFKAKFDTLSHRFSNNFSAN